MKKLTIFLIAIITIILLFLYFKTPSEQVNKNFDNIQLDGELDALLKPMPTKNIYKGLITTGYFKGTATIQNIDAEFDITITNAYFDGILEGKVNKNESLFSGKAKGTLNGHIQGTYKIKKQSNYLFWIIILTSIILLITIIRYVIIKYKKEPDVVDMDEKEMIVIKWLNLNRYAIETHPFTSVIYPKNTITFFFTGKGMGIECYSKEINRNNNKLGNIRTYSNMIEMKNKINILENLELRITNDDNNIKIKRKRRGDEF